MAWGNRPSNRKFRRLSPLVGVVTAAASLFALSGTASAGNSVNGVTLVSGSAFGERIDVHPFGGNLVSGPTPSVTLPSTGGNVSDSRGPIIVPQSGPAIGVFLTTTGPLTAHTQGSVGATGSATSNASLAGVSSLGGDFTSSSITSRCVSDANGSTASTTLAANSMLKLSKAKTITLPTSPVPNKTYNGIDNSPGASGDTFTVILNEQTPTSGAGNTGITVNAVHLILHGPTATGDIVLAQSHCDSTVSSGPTPCTQVSGTVTGPVVVGPGQNICYVDANITGGITVQQGGQVSITNSTVSGGVKSDGAVAFTLCGSDLKDPGAGPTLSVTNTTGAVRIGDPASGCAGNAIAGNVKVATNSGGVVFGNNFVGGNATFTANTSGPIVIKNNFIGGVLACTTNSLVSNAGQPNAASNKTGQCTGV